jgi:hypothetical protein
VLTEEPAAAGRSPALVADKYDDLYAVVPAQLTPPWDQAGVYRPDYQLLHALIDVTVQNGKAFDAQTGALAAATNAWVATELRRAGIEPNRVWPRAEPPRTLPWDATAAASKVKLRKDPKRLPASWGASNTMSKGDLLAVQQQTVEALLAEIGKGPALPGNPANILGAHFPKEIDVSMARYDRGLELGVSTKTMISSPTKNIPNRREEASGDLLNIRRRFPLCAFGFFFLLEYDIAQNQGWFDKVIDMCRKVSLSTPGDEANSYDASCLIVVELKKKKPRKTVVHSTVPPEDLRADIFFARMLDNLLMRSQSDDHRAARRLWEAAGRAP